MFTCHKIPDLCMLCSGVYPLIYDMLYFLWWFYIVTLALVRALTAKYSQRIFSCHMYGDCSMIFIFICDLNSVLV